MLDLKSIKIKMHTNFEVILNPFKIDYRFIIASFFESNLNDFSNFQKENRT